MVRIKLLQNQLGSGIVNTNILKHVTFVFKTM